MGNPVVRVVVVVVCDLFRIKGHLKILLSELLLLLSVTFSGSKVTGKLCCPSYVVVVFVVGDLFMIKGHWETLLSELLLLLLPVTLLGSKVVDSLGNPVCLSS